MDLEQISDLMVVFTPIIAIVLVFFGKKILSTQDIQLSVQETEAARQAVSDAIVRVAGAINSDKPFTFNDGVKYVEKRMKQSLAKVDMKRKDIEEVLEVEIKAQSSKKE